MPHRRRFLQMTAGAAGLVGLHAAGLLRAAAAVAADTPVTPAAKPLELLFLGGTGFIGPHQIRHALARGHKVTIFNRGRRSGLFGDGVQELTGDRDDKVGEGLNALRTDRTWDAVIDNSGYVPRHVRDAVALLKDRCRRYVYVSTVAAYPEGPGTYAEDAELATLDDPTVETVTWETYGPLKAACDRIVRRELGDKATVVRPTYIVGPGDTTDRFTWWVDRLHRGGPVVGPAHPEVAVQVVDARDLCPWLVTLAENGTPGAFNAAGPAYTRRGLLWAVRGTAEADVELLWPTPEQAETLEPFAPMLDWGSESRVFPGDASRAAGMTYRSLADSTLGTLAWWRDQPQDRRDKPRGWPDAAKEAATIKALQG